MFLDNLSKTPLLLALLLTPAVAPGQTPAPDKTVRMPKEATPTSFESRKTKTATVYLVGSKSLAWDVASKHGAQGGIEFSFLVVPSAPKGAAPAVTGPEDFKVGGESYAARTAQRLRRAIKPETKVEDPAKVQRRGKTLQEIFGLAAGQGTVVSTAFFGSALPVRGEFTVSLTVGKEPGEVVEFKLER